MDKREDGGAAFARPATHVSEADFPIGFSDHGDAGMSLRDWFAGQALAGLAADSDMRQAISTKYGSDTAAVAQAVAMAAYAFSDALLAARTKAEGEE